MIQAIHRNARSLLHREAMSGPADGGVDAETEIDHVRAFDFLLSAGFDWSTLLVAADESARFGLATHEGLLSLGWIKGPEYVEALARALDADVVQPAEWHLIEIDRREPTAGPRYGWLKRGREAVLVIDATAFEPDMLAQILKPLRWRAQPLLLADGAILRRAAIARRRRHLVSLAVRRLGQRKPEFSAASGMWFRQRLALAFALCLLIGLIAARTGVVETVITALLAIVFAAVVGLRAMALAMLLREEPKQDRWLRVRLSDAELPRYTVLVPLFHEALVLPDLIGALRRIDYPGAKLDIKIILEWSDAETIAAARRLALRPPFEIVIVPDRLPRTKPKALNYALELARGELVTIFDAEDIPEPHQLREAAAAFHSADQRLACVQARLAIDNPGDGWLARQFALEYLALFDGLLPGLARLGVPLPLGGTSNHFRGIA